MIKRITLAIALLAFAVAAAVAAPWTGTVAAIDGKNVQITVAAEKPDWVKKGAAVVVKDEAGKTIAGGKVTEVSGASITISSRKASELKVGQAVTLEKSKGALAGC